MANKLINIEPVKTPESIDNALKNITDQPTRTLGKIFDGWLYLHFGGFLQRVRRRKFMHDIEFDSFKQTVLQGVQSIPAEKVCPPNQCVIYSALDGITYTESTSYIRELFSNLVVSSMHSDFSVYNHVAFLEIVKQLSSIDAHILKAIYHRRHIAICKVFLLNDSDLLSMLDGYNGLFPSADDADNDVFAEFPNLKGTDESLHHILLEEVNFPHYKVEQSIDNLMRLGIVSVNYSNKLPNVSYEDFRNEPIIADYLSRSEDAAPYVLIPGTCNITAFGTSFAKVCLD